jgi:hypothetical protein
MSVTLLFFSKMLYLRASVNSKKFSGGYTPGPPLLGEGIGIREGWERIEGREGNRKGGKGVREKGRGGKEEGKEGEEGKILETAPPELTGKLNTPLMLMQGDLVTCFLYVGFFNSYT